MRSSTNWLILIIIVLLLSAAPAWGAKPYKIYVINRYGAWDVVCDSYTVQKDDHVWDILRRKGRIAEDDFPKFVSILKDLNPHIKDVNKIYPNQNILVPLKQIQAKEGHAEAGPRYITIPIIPDVLYKSRKVRAGECLSKIVTAYLGVRWDQLSKAYFQTFRRLNPRIKDLDLIYPGQRIRIPELSSQEPPAATPGFALPGEDLPVQITARDQVEATPLKSTPAPVEAPPAERIIAKLAIQGPAVTEPSTVPPEEDLTAQQEAQASAISPKPGISLPVETQPVEEEITESDAEDTSVTEPEPPAGEEEMPAKTKTGDEVAQATAMPPKPAAPLPTETSPAEDKISKLVTHEPSAPESKPATPEEDVPDQPIAEEEVQADATFPISKPSAPSTVETLPAEKEMAKDETSPASEDVSRPQTVSSKKDVSSVCPGKTTPTPTPRWQEVVSGIADELGGKLLASGRCYFPGKDRSDIALDLAAFPVIELKKGRHLLFETGARLTHDIEEAIRASWEGLLIIHADAQEADAVVLDKVFRAVLGQRVQKVLDLPALDDGVLVTLRGDWVFPQEAEKGIPPKYQCITLIETPEEYSSSSIVEYLARENIRVIDILTTASVENKPPSLQDKKPEESSVSTIDGSGQEAFVSGLVRAIGYSYEPGVPLSFDYAGFQIQTNANLIYGGDGLDIVVDFGTFYGDAKAAIEAGGLSVLSIRPEDNLLTIAKNILEAMGSSYTEAPVFFAANRKLAKTTSLTIPGFLISHGKEKRALLVQAPLHSKLLDFLSEQQITIMEIKERLE